MIPWAMVKKFNKSTSASSGHKNANSVLQEILSYLNFFFFNT